MAADSINGHIEWTLKRIGDVFDLEDWKDVIQTSVKRLHVLNNNMKKHFFNIPAIITQKRTRSQEGAGALPYLETLVEVRFERGSIGFQYKTSFK
ncbi:hypothetical protein SK128_009037, partial [Halocaridina rubra]